MTTHKRGTAYITVWFPTMPEGVADSFLKYLRHNIFVRALGSTVPEFFYGGRIVPGNRRQVTPYLEFDHSCVNYGNGITDTRRFLATALGGTEYAYLVEAAVIDKAWRETERLPDGEPENDAVSV